MKHIKATAVVAAASLLGCSGSHEKSDLEFEIHPETNFIASDCNRNPSTWVTQIDSTPAVSSTITIGFYEDSEMNERQPDFIVGATIRDLGNFAYEVATSDHEPGMSTEIDLKEENFSTLLQGEEGKYSAVLSAELKDDGLAYFRLNCLAGFGFHGDREVVPLEELPTIPPASPETTEPSVSV